MKIRVVWEAPLGAGHLEIRGGEFVGSVEIPAEAVVFTAEIRGENVSPGDFPTLVRVMRGEHPFTFFLRDVSCGSPLWYPLAQCAVLPEADGRSYTEVSEAIRAQGLLTDAERMCTEEEETYEDACRRSTKDPDVPVWLGIARDARFFRANRHLYMELGSWGEVTVWNHTNPQCLPDSQDPMRFIFEVGPGSHGCHQVSRRLHDGCLPILHVVQKEQTIDYEMTFFATRETRPLGVEDLCQGGTDAVLAYSQMGWPNLREAEKAALTPDAFRKGLGDQEDAMVCWLHVEAVNRTQTPAYAFLRVPHLSVEKCTFEDGLMAYGGTGVVCAATLDGRPMPQREMAVLVPAGGRVVCDWRMTHGCISRERGAALRQTVYQAHLDGALAYWRAMLGRAAQVRVPEQGIQERIQAGLLHLELNTMGRADGTGPLCAAVGEYAPIGTESSPMILFFDAMGQHETAGRCIEWFLSRQDERGYINSYGDYESETGPVLWCAAEHYRVTRDKAWLRKNLPALAKSARFLLSQRNAAKAKSGGLVAGKCSDPKDDTCAFFLNAGIYLGIAGLADVLQEVDPALAAELADDARGYREDIRKGLEQSAMESPLVPLLDGSWTPALGPWPGTNGNVAYHADGGEWFSHGTIFGRLDSGAMALFLTDALPVEDTLMDLVLKSHQHPHFRENAGLSQPYYFRHDIAHLRRDETKLFLKCFYNQFVSLQDRQSYTFWEHYFHVTSHKTHEEGWFLMQCRWMLALEEQGGLTLLKGVPRRWLAEGKEIEIHGLATHFGKTELTLKCQNGCVAGAAAVERPGSFLRIRLPHPQGARVPAEVQGGSYDPATETLTLAQHAFLVRW